MLKKLNIKIFGYISNNIFNVEDQNGSILISDNINHLGTYKFDKNLHDFNLDYNSEITEEISKRILSDA